MSRCLPALLRQLRSWWPDQMLNKGERSVGFSLDGNTHAKPTVSRTSDIHFGDREEDRGGKGFSSRLINSARLSAVRFFRKTSRALDFISGSRRQPPSKVSSSMTPQRFAAPEETHLSEAIEDCIKFLNSSSRRSC
ncbi:hypothetical protein BHE74_00013148 [Ensete ventricosum]|uniref:Uncharacterized protein n=1 Tax=Ensete ventricosum TaxID=4639 RepID=A0A427ALE9_ENSVE|nr:hypothetical protein B296_00016337 [Ensete ventricosum]RWW20502.1 hypothetical protein GW17_00015392 [Ensete ventricosum]RWW78626.1 hypothetical protein BHE74_00013148 [Ensete ventricosum]